MQPKFILRKAIEASFSFDLEGLPKIDTVRKTAVYIRQSKNNADTKNGESRETQLALLALAIKLRGENDESGVLKYDEGAGKSGQKRIDERPELQRLWQDMEAGLIGSIIVAREDRLFRNKHLDQVATFTQKAERLGIVVIVPPITMRQSFRYYDFRQLTHLRDFQEKMIAAYDYIANHTAYMNLNQQRKNAKGYYDGRNLPPGLVISKFGEKSDQKPILYEPWAKVMQTIFKRAKELNWLVHRLIKELESLPYVFPEPLEEDKNRYYFRTSMRKVPGGYKPYAGAIKDWFKNVCLIGWWVVNKETGETIEDNHAQVINRTLFEEGFIHATGYRLDGTEVPKAVRQRKFQERSVDETPPLVFRYCLTSPKATYITVHKNEHTKGYGYEIMKMSGDKMLAETLFWVHGEAFDKLIVDRLANLAEVDRHLATKIEEYFLALLGKQRIAHERVDTQLDDVLEQLRRKRTRLLDIEDDMDQGTVDMLKVQIKELVAKQAQLENKKKNLKKTDNVDDLKRFYRVLGNFKEKYATLSLEERQRLFELLMDEIEVEMVSPHWMKLTIKWIGPVMWRPDICYIWRNSPHKMGELSHEEIILLKSHFNICHCYSELLRLFPNRTWASLDRFARRHQAYAKDRQLLRRISDVPRNVAWNDLLVFSDYQAALEQVAEGINYCKNTHSPYYPMWILNPNLNSFPGGFFYSSTEDQQSHSRRDGKIAPG